MLNSWKLPSEPVCVTRPPSINTLAPWIPGAYKETGVADAVTTSVSWGDRHAECIHVNYYNKNPCYFTLGPCKTFPETENPCTSNNGCMRTVKSKETTFTALHTHSAVWCHDRPAAGVGVAHPLQATPPHSLTEITTESLSTVNVTSDGWTSNTMAPWR